MKKILPVLTFLFLAFTARADFELSDLKWAEDVGARVVPKGEKVYNVNDYGAKPDGITLNSKTIQAAIDACNAVGGGVVTFGEGDYLTGSIYVKEGVTLDIPEGTRILGSTDIADYPVIDTRVAGIEMKWPSALINVLKQKNVMITGKGIVHAQGKVFWDKYWTMRRDYEQRGLRWIVDYDCDRPRTLLVQESQDVTLSGITLQQAGFWTVQVLYSEYCTVDGLVIQNNIDGHGPSTDGVDIDSSRKILVENCDIDCNDDNFCLKAGRDSDGLRVNRPTEYVVIRNCIARKGAALFTCGSETSGGIRNILVHDMKGDGPSSGFLIKSAMVRGGTVENIYIKNIDLNKIRTAINVNMNWNPSYSYSKLPAEYEGKELPEHWTKLLTVVSPEQGTPHFRNINLSNYRVTGATTALSVAGVENSMIENFNLDNVYIQAANGGSVSYARNWKLNNVTIESGTPLTVKDSENVNFPSVETK